MTGTTQQFLPLRDWPAADMLAWQAATARTGILDDGAPASHLAQSTRDDFTHRYGCFLGFAKRNGLLASDGPPAASVTKETILAYINELESQVSSVTVHGCVLKALRVTEWIAPERDWRWLRRIACRLATKRRPRNKRSRMIEVGRLYQLGTSLMDCADTDTSKRHFGRALDYRDGLMIALLAACVLRRGNFVDLEIGRTLLRQADGYVIHIPAHESKTRRLIEMPVLNDLSRRIDCFLGVHRPRFKDSSMHQNLWPSRHGGPLTESQLYNIIVARTKAAFGYSVNPHLFRDCAVTTLAIHHGAHMGTGMALLGHRSPRVTQKHYNQADMSSAIRGYQTILANRRARRAE